MANGAVGAIAADYEQSGKDFGLTAVIESGANETGLLFGGDEGGFILEVAALAVELFEEKLLGAVLGNHGDEGVWGLLRGEVHVSNSALMRDDVDIGDAIGCVEERSGNPGHIENFEGTRKDGQGFGMLRLSGIGFDEAITQTAPRTLIGEKKTDGSGANDEDIGIGSGIWHRQDS